MTVEKFNAAFRKWFGDSKVVDADGEPLVVWHGSKTADFQVFDFDRAWDIGMHFGTKEAAHTASGAGFLRSFYLSLQTPLELLDPEDWTDDYPRRHSTPSTWQQLTEMGIITETQAEDVIKEIDEYPGKALEKHMRAGKILRGFIEAAGYDGIVYANTIEDDGRVSWIAFHPEQIKSATGNDGTWDADDPDIRSNSMDENPYEITPTMQRWRVDEKVTCVVLMKPMDFLKLTTAREIDRDIIKSEAATLDDYNQSALSGRTSIPPFLGIDPDGTVIAHEGRHRVAAVLNNNEEVVPISIKLRDSYGYSRQLSFFNIPWIWKNQFTHLPAFQAKNLLEVLETSVQEEYQDEPVKNSKLSREEILELFSDDPVESSETGEILKTLGMNPPPKLGTVWPISAKLKIIDHTVDPPHWKTLIEVMDTPGTIDEAYRELKAQGFKNIWSFGQASGKQYLGENPPEETNPFDPFPAELPKIENILKSNWEKISERLNQESWGDQALMPVCLQEIKQHGEETLFGIEEISAACEKLSQTFGCGHYGCVYATNRPEWVFKVTTDQSEALFITLLKYLKEAKNFEIPPGITSYLGVFRLKGKYRSYETRPAYCLWRQEASNVGEELDENKNVKGYKWVTPLMEKFLPDMGLSGFQKIISDLLYNLDRWRSYGYQVMVRLKEKRKNLGKEKYFNWLDDDFPDLAEDDSSMLGYELKEALNAADNLASNPFGSLVGEALLSFYEQKILLVDIHTGNLGHVQDRNGLPVITDPGFAIPLTSEYKDLQVPWI